MSAENCSHCSIDCTSFCHLRFKCSFFQLMRNIYSKLLILIPHIFSVSVYCPSYLANNSLMFFFYVFSLLFCLVWIILCIIWFKFIWQIFSIIWSVVNDYFIWVIQCVSRLPSSVGLQGLFSEEYIFEWDRVAGIKNIVTIAECKVSREVTHFKRP